VSIGVNKHEQLFYIFRAFIDKLIEIKSNVYEYKNILQKKRRSCLKITHFVTHSESPYNIEMLELRRDIYSVSKLNQEVRALLESSFPNIWIQGELSNFIAHGSGHWYFSLKDQKAQISCAMFRGRNRMVQFKPESGNQIIARVKISLYEPRGNYQLIVEHMEPAGEGLLRQQYEELKNKLDHEGLFAPELKKPLPPFPKQIGIITSETGAALRDILSVLKRRYSYAKVLIHPTTVQGQGAADNIVSALEEANNIAENDVLILARGGGSVEDLWSFNEEKVARAIFACDIPIVTGIGHEIDFTISDFVADYRAPTPSAAAEAVSPDQVELLADINSQFSRIKNALNSQLMQKSQFADALDIRLQQQHPLSRIQQLNERTQNQLARLQVTITSKLQLIQSRLETNNAKLARFDPKQLLQQHQNQLESLLSRLKIAISFNLKQSNQSLLSVSRSLDAISPLATLERGYSILNISKDNALLSSTKQIKNGDLLTAKLAQGELECEVTRIKS